MRSNDSGGSQLLTRTSHTDGPVLPPTPPKTYRIGLIPGDGIGPEVVDEAVRVLSVASAAEGFVCDLAPMDLGAERYLVSSDLLLDSDLIEISKCDAVLLGAVGDPRVAPGILEKEILLRLRRELDLYVNLRPARMLRGVPSPLISGTPDSLDFVIVRENTEGLYAGRSELKVSGSGEQTAVEVSMNTARAVTRLIAYAFDLAEQLGKSLTLVHKANVLERAGGLYRRIFDETASRYASVKVDYQHVDAVAMLMALEPERFQVIVTDNLFGDILSDLAAGLIGGPGFAPSGNIHPGQVSIFEPVHGSAPGIAGTGRANPIAAILSAAMMLTHLGEEPAAKRIEKAVEAVAVKAVTERLDTRSTGELIAGAV